MIRGEAGVSSGDRSALISRDTSSPEAANNLNGGGTGREHCHIARKRIPRLRSTTVDSSVPFLPLHPSLGLFIFLSLSLFPFVPGKQGEFRVSDYAPPSWNRASTLRSSVTRRPMATLFFPHGSSVFRVPPAHGSPASHPSSRLALPGGGPRLVCHARRATPRYSCVSFATASINTPLGWPARLFRAAQDNRCTSTAPACAPLSPSLPLVAKVD